MWQQFSEPRRFMLYAWPRDEGGDRNSETSKSNSNEPQLLSSSHYCNATLIIIFPPNPIRCRKTYLFHSTRHSELELGEVLSR